MAKKVKDEEIKEEKIEEVKAEEVKAEEVKEDDGELACDGNCESCDIDCLGDYEFEPVHKKASVANIFSIVCKVVALLFIIVGTYEYVLSVLSYIESGYEAPAFLEVFYSWMGDVMLNATIFFGIGELTNIINRIKESIMY